MVFFTKYIKDLIIFKESNLVKANLIASLCDAALK